MDLKELQCYKFGLLLKATEEVDKNSACLEAFLRRSICQQRTLSPPFPVLPARASCSVSSRTMSHIACILR
jgi:hypothetical protein